MKLFIFQCNLKHIFPPKSWWHYSSPAHPEDVLVVPEIVNSCIQYTAKRLLPVCVQKCTSAKSCKVQRMVADWNVPQYAAWYFSPYGFYGKYIQRTEAEDEDLHQQRNELSLMNSLWYSFGTLMQQVHIFSFIYMILSTVICHSTS